MPFPYIALSSFQVSCKKPNAIKNKYLNPTVGGGGGGGEGTKQWIGSFFVIAERQYWQKHLVSPFVYDGFNFKLTYLQRTKKTTKKR